MCVGVQCCIIVLAYMPCFGWKQTMRMSAILADVVHTIMEQMFCFVVATHNSQRGPAPQWGFTTGAFVVIANPEMGRPPTDIMKDGHIWCRNATRATRY